MTPAEKEPIATGADPEQHDGNKKRANNGNIQPEPKRTRTNPFQDLKINDDSILHTVKERTLCSKCKKSVKYFCYRCFGVVGMERSKVPYIKLPVHLDIIKHEMELDGKSTAIHARVIAEDDVDIYNWTEASEENHLFEGSLLLFPGPDAKRLEEIPRDSFDRIIVIDGTWKQASRIVRETPALQNLQKVTIQARKTNFWRYQQKSENHLATIEAIYYLYREYAETFEGGYEDGRYDNLLFYYRFFYNLIQDTYRQKPDKKFTHRHRQDYIQYDDNENENEQNQNKAES